MDAGMGLDNPPGYFVYWIQVILEGSNEQQVDRMDQGIERPNELVDPFVFDNTSYVYEHQLTRSNPPDLPKPFRRSSKGFRGPEIFGVDSIGASACNDLQLSGTGEPFFFK